MSIIKSRSLRNNAAVDVCRVVWQTFRSSNAQQSKCLERLELLVSFKHLLFVFNIPAAIDKIENPRYIYLPVGDVLPKATAQLLAGEYKLCIGQFTGYSQITLPIIADPASIAATTDIRKCCLPRGCFWVCMVLLGCIETGEAAPPRCKRRPSALVYAFDLSPNQRCDFIWYSRSAINIAVSSSWNWHPYIKYVMRSISMPRSATSCQSCLVLDSSANWNWALTTLRANEK